MLRNQWLAVVKIKYPVLFMKKKVQVQPVQKIASVQLRIVNLPWQKIFLGVALVAATGGALFATKTLSGIEKNIAAAKEEARPANIKVTKITTPDCTNCFSADDAVAALKKQNVLIGEERAVTYDSADGQSLIKQFSIKRVPTYVATGEVAKNNIGGFIKSNGKIKNKTFVFTKVTPIFVDAVTKKEMGKVTATILTDPSCTQCINPKLTVDAYKKAGIKIVAEKEVLWNSAEGQSIVSQYKITKTPTFILSSDVSLYEEVKASWSQIGTVEKDGTYVARNLILPYRDLGKGQVVGLVNLIYLTDSACTDCYNVQEVQKPILTNSFRVGLASERTVDSASAEGKGLVSQYKITKLPTILLSPDADQYANLKSVWPSVGTVESDGWYVFREMQQLGNVVYKDLVSNQVIKPGVSNTAQQSQ